MKDHKFLRNTRTRLQVFLICMLLFSLGSLMLHQVIGIAELLITIALAAYSAHRSRVEQKEMEKFVESIAEDAETASNTPLSHFPLPMAVLRMSDGTVVWANQPFWKLMDREHPGFGIKVTDAAPAFSTRWLTDGRTRCPETVEAGGRHFEVFGSITHSGPSEETYEYRGVTYWFDVTEYENTRRRFEDSRPVVMSILVDNYEELMKPLTDRQRTELRSRLDETVEQWCEGKGGILRRVDRDRYLFLLEFRHLENILREKFSLLETMHSIINLSGIHATVSIGVGTDAVSLEDALSYSILAVDMALSRGGDQAVVKNRFTFEFFGGRGAEVETRTKVRSRVVAGSLSRLIRDSSDILIMGHRYADLDAVGAAVGIACIARKHNCTARILINPDSNAAEPLIRSMQELPEYKDTFVTPQEAMLLANSRTLLVVVDTHRPEQVEYRELLDTCSSRLAVIDHHRRAATYIKDATLTLYEPNASSACELLAEMLQELVEQNDILPAEADALLAGIVLDTKNFTMRTGERTFDAAAFLRRSGADPSRVKTFFQSGMQDAIQRYDILKRAEIYRGIALAAAEEVQNRIVPAQAADELLNISGVSASVVLYPTQDGIAVSARSIGELNVQVLLEKLGGGGNRAAAGAQLKGISMPEAEKKIRTAIDEYISTD